MVAGCRPPVMDGITPAVVPDTVVTSLKAREVNGLIELHHHRNSDAGIACASCMVRSPDRSDCSPE